MFVTIVGACDMHQTMWPQHPNGEIPVRGVYLWVNVFVCAVIWFDSQNQTVKIISNDLSDALPHRHRRFDVKKTCVFFVVHQFCEMCVPRRLAGFWHGVLQVNNILNNRLPTKQEWTTTPNKMVQCLGSELLADMAKSKSDNVIKHELPTTNQSFWVKIYGHLALVVRILHKCCIFLS